MSQAKLAALFARLDNAGRIAENTLLILVLGSMVAVAFLQIILREVFSTGVIWANELVRILVLWLAIVGAVAAARDNRHIRIDLLSHLLSDKLVKGIRIVVDLFAAAVSGIVAVYLWRYIQVEVELEFTVLDGLPAFPAHVIAPIGFVLLSYRFLILAIKQLIELFGSNAAEESAT
ncbi:MAG: TRAP transporter small permease [Pseudomonadota bacterium]